MGKRAKPGEALRYFREVVLAYEGEECLIWPFGRGGGGRAKLRFDGRMQEVHRLVCIQHNGPPPSSKHEASHNCGGGHLACVAKRHLEWKTHEQNMADTVVHGTSPRGERHGSAKLTEEDVYKVRALIETGMPQRDIASLFGVHPSLISSIRIGRIWGWLPESEAA